MSGIDVYSHINKVYSNFTILQFEYFKNYNKSRQPFYKVICKCGNKSIKGLWYLRSRKSKGCIKCQEHGNTLSDGKASKNSILNQYKRQAKNRNYKFEITNNEFFELIDKNCYYCNSKPSNVYKSLYNTGDYIYNGIDRLDNNLGYTLKNCVTCCYMCNRCKSDLNLTDFKKWIKKVYNKTIAGIDTDA